jgi:Lhr-like helicase
MNKQDYIERIITDNLDGLNSMEPPDGHFERFQKRLKDESKGKTFRWNTVWKVAAAVVFVFLATNQARLWLIPEENQPVTLSSISPEYADVEFYYASSIRTGLNTLNSLADDGVISKEENQIMQEEFEAFESRYMSLQKDLQAHPDDERVINAMIEYYQDKFEVITMILNKLQEVKQKKNKSHETEI